MLGGVPGNYHKFRNDIGTGIIPELGNPLYIFWELKVYLNPKALA